MKTILGLDLGTNSIGWALTKQDFAAKSGEILGMGSRILPMSMDVLGEFEKGNSISQTAERTRLRSVRRLKERHLLRRERLHRVLNVLGWLPRHYAASIDFDKRLGKFLPDTEVKFAYGPDGFIFKTAFEEMLADFRHQQPQLVTGGKKIPYDWTIYYLRKKALTLPVSSQELAWLLLHFNQKRGYYQLRGEDADEQSNKSEEFYTLAITDVTADEPQKGKSEIWYNVTLENGWVYRRASKTPLFNWKGSVRDFIVTTEFDEDGNVKKNKDGVEKRSFRSPAEDDWKLRKKKTESEIDRSRKTVGEFIYDTLLQMPDTKVRGALVRTIERKYYKDELQRILSFQATVNPVLRNATTLKACIDTLYPHNAAHAAALGAKGLEHLFVNDIIFYQRPLRSQKDTVSDCPLESRTYIEDGIKVVRPLKCVSRSHPDFQEFRLWQWLSNLRIINRRTDSDETDQLLPDSQSRAALYHKLSQRKEIDQKTLLKELGKKEATHRWNYVEEKRYPCAETVHLIVSRSAALEEASLFNDHNLRLELWHIIYSVTDKVEYEKALRSFARRHSINEDAFCEAFRKVPPFPSAYGAYSLKAIRRLLPLMRVGSCFNEADIDTRTLSRIDKILTGEYDESIRTRVREKAMALNAVSDFSGLPEWLAKYAVYDRHAESSDTDRWTSVADLEEFLRTFRQHSLRNPIVEQVITEALRVVKDIWRRFGDGKEGFFDEIHVELGRELKNPAGAREEMSRRNLANENTNLRIKTMLAELLYDNTPNVRPHSPMQQEALKIYEEGVLLAATDLPDDIARISKMATPSRAEVQRYLLWVGQRYRSVYTGAVIPLSRLFTPEYEIEHIIPQSRYFDDSLSNKVICEAAVNKLKDNQTGLEFIRHHHGQIVSLSNGNSVKILSEEAYTTFVNEAYAQNRTKKVKLLSEDIPEKMIERQLNDTRYISRYVMHLLSYIVRQHTNDDGVIAKNVLAPTGQVTSALRHDWGLDHLWNELILPRFIRLNDMLKTDQFTAYSERNAKLLPVVPPQYQRGFQKKRIDHRHHALDALVVACATRNHINYINNSSALSEKRGRKDATGRYDLRASLCEKVYNQGEAGNYSWRFVLPWNAFVPDARDMLSKIIVSFKQNTRVINTTRNATAKIENGSRTHAPQTKGEHWAMRKPLHKDTVFGKVALTLKKEVSFAQAADMPQCITDSALRKHLLQLQADGLDKKKIVKLFKDNNYLLGGKTYSRVEVTYTDDTNVAVRKPLDTSFTDDKILSITDTGIQQILLVHLRKSGSAELAFSPEGIEEMNRNIVQLNIGRPHKPVLKVRVFEPMGNKFAVGQTGNKTTKYAEAAKGTNLFFAIYADENGKREYETIPLNVVAERLKQQLGPVPPLNDKGKKLLFYLSPNDLVTVYENGDNHAGDSEFIYKIVSFTGGRLYGIPHFVATSVVDKVEFTQLNKMEVSLTQISLKENCRKIILSRIGEVIR